ncbi:hypothetical protein CPLU01_03125 [Colletotrichum plurivorum]|uniref:Uncharacterized protein n=1 Tax=Colletotrichum plurivorum TaxID=2175906 RepID=A0A8H6KU07_9PEZI|nr:hypothetical protein CPLU01_03125 [Colletotrichum plurivorum]
MELQFQRPSRPTISIIPSQPSGAVLSKVAPRVLARSAMRCSRGPQSCCASRKKQEASCLEGRVPGGTRPQYVISLPVASASHPPSSIDGSLGSKKVRPPLPSCTIGPTLLTPSFSPACLTGDDPKTPPVEAHFLSYASSVCLSAYTRHGAAGFSVQPHQKDCLFTHGDGGLAWPSLRVELATDPDAFNMTPVVTTPVFDNASRPS